MGQPSDAIALDGSLKTFLSAPADERQSALRPLLSELKKRVSTQPDVVSEAIRQAISHDLDYSAAEGLSRVYQSLKKIGSPAGGRRLAILGSYSTHQLAALLELFLFGNRVKIDIFESDYGVLQQEILDPSSRLHDFKPDIVYLAVNRRALGSRPSLTDATDRVNKLVVEEVQRWHQLWTAAHSSMGCQIIQNNFDPPPHRSLSNHEMRHHASLSRFISRVNQRLQEEAPAFVTIYDVDHLAASLGRWAFGDDRFYYHAKMPCAPEFLVPYAHGLASVIAAQSGTAKKCLVLDLDNTLWGGVIGDDGIAGIKLGQGEAEGEAFQAFQHYVNDLARRGVILAVCSKNTEAIAREAFDNHPEMVLRTTDIAAFVANWDDKATNLRRIAKKLEIGLDSLVFVDDNPMERALVRELVPEVAVPELPPDPASYIQALDRHAYFQTVGIGTEDLTRVDMYRANAERQQAQVTTGNIDDFLKSLEMKARVEPVTSDNLQRVAQLVSRSNQFNLTTRRHSAAALLKIAESPDWITVTISLADRFGDNGLICVILCQIDNNELVIDTWLMSCRVLKRGVEHYCRNLLLRIARQHKLSAILGEYIPTPKNALVSQHYLSLGFNNISGDESGRSWWRLDTSVASELETFIQE